MLILIVAGGPDKGKVFDLLDDSRIVLGREGGKVRLNDPKCSRQHAKLTRTGDDWYLEDNGSRHGTFRNHKPIDGKVRVKDGDYIQIGKTVLVMAHMPEEHLERLALIGPAPANAEPDAPIVEAAPLPELPAAQSPGTVARKQRRESKAPTGLIIGASLAAAGLMVGVSVALHLSNAEKTEQLRQQIAALEMPETIVAETDTTATDEKLASIITRLDERVADEVEEQKARDAVMGEILAAVSADPTEALDKKLDTVLAKIDAMPDHGDRLETLAAAIDEQKAFGKQLAAIAEAIERDPGYGEQLAALAKTIEAIPDPSGKLAALEKAIAEQPVYGEQLAALKKAVESVPNYDTQLAALRQSVKNQPDYGKDIATLAEAVSGTPDYRKELRAMAAAIDALPDNTEKLAALEQAIADQPRYEKHLLAMTKLIKENPGKVSVTAEMPKELAEQVALLSKQTKSNAEALAALDKKLDAGETTDTQAVMAKIDKTLGQMLDELQKTPPTPAKDDPVLAALVQSQKQTQTLFDEVLEELKKRPTAQQVAAQLKKEMKDAPAGSSRKTNALLKDVLSELEKQPSAEQLATELAKATAEDGQATTELLGKIMAKVEKTEAMTKKLDELSELVDANGADEVAPVLTEMLATLRAVDKRLPDNAEVLEAVAALQASLPADPTQKLDAALASLEERADAKTLRALSKEVRRLAEAQEASAEAQALLEDMIIEMASDDTAETKLAKIEKLLGDQPEQTRKAVDAALAKLDTTGDDGTTDAALASAIEDIRATVRGEVRAELRAERIAAAREQLALAEAGIAPTAGHGVTAPAATAYTAQQPLTPVKTNDGLSDTERAYKLAFESGKAVRLGVGKINPKTGKATEGRLLDPEAARAAGITDWRDWYLMDDFAERMRLQKRAMRYLADSADGADTVSLPGSEPSIHATIPPEGE